MEDGDAGRKAHEVFKALADPTRLRILNILRDGEHCVSDITTILGIPQAKASHHLVYLHRMGLVESRHQGLWSFYRLSPAKSGFRRKLLECIRHCSESVPGAADDRRRAAQLRKTGGCCPGLARGSTKSVRRPA
jgi:ArsR family transcriptional regulator, arsenate/arsenite/antimonite-responsive transcriptional repressor